MKQADNPTYLAINKWQPDDRPRERLLKYGAQSLSTAELLAILIGTGSPKESAVGLMQRIFASCNGNLRQLGKMELSDLQQFKGIGSAKAITLLAAFELSRRWAIETVGELPQLTSAEAAYKLVRPRMADLSHEEFHALLLDQGLHCLKDELIGKGGLTATQADIRLIMRSAIVRKATAIIVCHNHPGGTLRPSRADDQLTEKIKQVAKWLDIQLVDHLIIGGDGYYSYAENGRL